MFSIVSRTEGLDGFGAELLKETRIDARKLVAQSGEALVRHARQKLDVRGGPSRPGDPPARETGALQESIGRTGPFTDPGTVGLAWGVGIGNEALARVNEWKNRGVNVFEYARLLEHGGTGADGRRYPPRSYIRATEAELEDGIEAHWKAHL